MALGFNKPNTPSEKKAAPFDFEAAMEEGAGDETALEDEIVDEHVEDMTGAGKGHGGIAPKYLIAAVGVILVVGFIALKLLGGREGAKDPVQPPTPTVVAPETSTSYGSGDNTSGTQGVVGDEVVDLERFTGDFEGNQVPLNYEVSSISFVNDMVNYEKFRATTGEGLELFWLDIIYKEKEYRAQIPYYIYVQLEDKGIIIVNMEVLTLVDGGTMITFMQVVSNYKELISQ